MNNPYQLTEQEKQDMIKRISNDISFEQEEMEIESSHNESVEDEEGLF
jgi:hypothetical protein